MKFSDLKRKIHRSVEDGGMGGGGRSASRPQFNKSWAWHLSKNREPSSTPSPETRRVLAQTGLKISQAFDSPSLRKGSSLNEAFGGLGAAVSPFSSSDVGVSPVEICECTLHIASASESSVIHDIANSVLTASPVPTRVFPLLRPVHLLLLLTLEGTTYGNVCNHVCSLVSPFAPATRGGGLF